MTPRSLRGVAFAAIVLVATLGLMEVASRLFWKVQYGVPLSRPERLLWALYPELWQVEWKDEDVRAKHPLRILFLGGSALHPAWGNVEQELRERLTATLRRPVVIYNMAAIAHTSRDSAVKYRALEGTPFDLVVFYHGINDARANDVPPDVFRPDYSHFAWYDAVNALVGCGRLVLPCTLRFLAVRAQDRLGLVAYASMEAPRPEWLAFGADVKSAASFEANLRSIVETAHARGEPVLVMTFATYVPDDYSLEAFNDGTLDYTLHLSPIEMWGTPPNVAAAVARHNEIVRRIAASDRGVRLVDQASLMPKGAQYFNDVCHMTGAGSAVFVDNMLGAVVEALGADRGRSLTAQATPPADTRTDEYGPP
jgi:hypothetical protein